jgi:hypothetical protein
VRSACCVTDTTNHPVGSGHPEEVNVTMPFAVLRGKSNELDLCLDVLVRTGIPAAQLLDERVRNAGLTVAELRNKPALS